MQHLATFFIAFALLAYSSQAAGTPDDSQSPLPATITNSFAQHLRQIQEQDATNSVAERARQQALARQLQQIQERQRERETNFHAQLKANLQGQMALLQQDRDAALQRVPPLMPPSPIAPMEIKRPRHQKPGLTNIPPGPSPESSTVDAGSSAPQPEPPIGGRDSGPGR